MFNRGGERYLVGERNMYRWHEWSYNHGVWAICFWISPADERTR